MVSPDEVIEEYIDESQADEVLEETLEANEEKLSHNEDLILTQDSLIALIKKIKANIAHPSSSIEIDNDTEASRSYKLVDNTSMYEISTIQELYPALNDIMSVSVEEDNETTQKYISFSQNYCNYTIPDSNEEILLYILTDDGENNVKIWNGPDITNEEHALFTVSKVTENQKYNQNTLFYIGVLINNYYAPFLLDAQNEIFVGGAYTFTTIQRLNYLKDSNNDNIITIHNSNDDNNSSTIINAITFTRNYYQDPALPDTIPMYILVETNNPINTSTTKAPHNYLYKFNQDREIIVEPVTIGTSYSANTIFYLGGEGPKNVPYIAEGASVDTNTLYYVAQYPDYNPNSAGIYSLKGLYEDTPDKAPDILNCFGKITTAFTSNNSQNQSSEFEDIKYISFDNSYYKKTNNNEEETYYILQETNKLEDSSLGVLPWGAPPIEGDPDERIMVEPITKNYIYNENIIFYIGTKNELGYYENSFIINNELQDIYTFANAIAKDGDQELLKLITILNKYKKLTKSVTYSFKENNIYFMKTNNNNYKLIPEDKKYKKNTIVYTNELKWTEIGTIGKLCCDYGFQDIKEVQKNGESKFKLLGSTNEIYYIYNNNNNSFELAQINDLYESNTKIFIGQNMYFLGDINNQFNNLANNKINKYRAESLIAEDEPDNYIIFKKNSFKYPAADGITLCILVKTIDNIPITTISDSMVSIENAMYWMGTDINGNFYEPLITVEPVQINQKYSDNTIFYVGVPARNYSLQNEFTYFTPIFNEITVGGTFTLNSLANYFDNGGNNRFTDFSIGENPDPFSIEEDDNEQIIFNITSANDQTIPRTVYLDDGYEAETWSSPAHNSAASPNIGDVKINSRTLYYNDGSTTETFYLLVECASGTETGALRWYDKNYNGGWLWVKPITTGEPYPSNTTFYVGIKQKHNYGWETSSDQIYYQTSNGYIGTIDTIEYKINSSGKFTNKFYYWKYEESKWVQYPKTSDTTTPSTTPTTPSTTPTTPSTTPTNPGTTTPDPGTTTPDPEPTTPEPESTQEPESTPINQHYVYSFFRDNYFINNINQTVDNLMYNANTLIYKKLIKVEQGDINLIINEDPAAGKFADLLEGSITTKGGIAAAKSIKAYKVHGAVFNDYAEYRHTENVKPGSCVVETGKGDLILSDKRLQLGANIVSDTYGFSIGENQFANTPIAVSGRVLAYPFENRNLFKPGEAVCSGPNGTVSRMTREEIRNWPDAIIGYVSEVPEYKVWGTDKINVNNRIWIKVH